MLVRGPIWRIHSLTLIISCADIKDFPSQREWGGGELSCAAEEIGKKKIYVSFICDEFQTKKLKLNKRRARICKCENFIMTARVSPIKIQPKTINLSTRHWRPENKPTTCVVL